MSTFTGMSCVVMSGACDGTVGTVMKVTKKWEWENIWTLFSITGYGLFPVALALWSMPDLPGVYRAVSLGVLMRTFLLGVGWGIGSTCFGLGLYMLGQSLGYTVIMGIVAVGGSLIPMLVTNPSSALTAGGTIIILSMFVAVVGVAFCGWAGQLRDGHLQESPHSAKRHYNFKLGFLVCLASGAFSCMLNLAFHFADPIAKAAAAQLGELSTDFRTNSPIWAVAMVGGFIPNFLYCLYLLVRKGTWRRYQQPDIGHYWLWGVGMGALFAADVALYGIGASNLGKLGTTVAWLVTTLVGMLIANCWGLVTGEWKGAPRMAKWHMVWGSLILFGSIMSVTYGNYILP
jgi:L-rhamnose-H+ transport protein